MIGIRDRGKAAAGLVVLTLLLSGCGAAKVPDTIEETSIVIEKNGTVISHTVGVFDKEYYDLSSLRKMAQEEVAAYNTAHQKGSVTPVKVERVEELAQKPGTVIVTYSYDSADTYTAYPYHEEQLFYGTVSQAAAAGFPLIGSAQVLIDPNSGQSITSEELQNGIHAQKHLLITNARALVYCPYKVEYASENVKVREDGSVDALNMGKDDAPVIILMKK